MMADKSEMDRCCLESEEQVVRVLIVDDDRDNRDLLAYAFASYELQITTCANATEALLKCMLHRFDFIVTDYDMPGLNGIELVKRVREKSPQSVIIGMSGNDRALEFLLAGANDFLQKPFIPYRLAMMIDGRDILS